MSNLKKTATQEIEVQEVNRNTSAGPFTYAIYKNKVVRRPAKRGRPVYNRVDGFKLSDKDTARPRTISVSSQLGRALLTLETA